MQGRLTEIVSMGAARHTELGLRVVKIDAERNLLFVRGAIPGARNGIVTVAKQGGVSRHGHSKLYGACMSNQLERHCAAVCMGWPPLF